MRDAHSVVQIDLFYMLFIHSHIITLTLPPVKYSTLCLLNLKGDSCNEQIVNVD